VEAAGSSQTYPHQYHITFQMAVQY